MSQEKKRKKKSEEHEDSTSSNVVDVDAFVRLLIKLVLCNKFSFLALLLFI